MVNATPVRVEPFTANSVNSPVMPAGISNRDRSPSFVLPRPDQLDRLAVAVAPRPDDRVVGQLERHVLAGEREAAAKSPMNVTS